MATPVDTRWLAHPAVLWAANTALLTLLAPAAAEAGLRLLRVTWARTAQQVRRAALLICLLAPAAAALSIGPAVGIPLPAEAGTTAAPVPSFELPVGGDAAPLPPLGPPPPPAFEAAGADLSNGGATTAALIPALLLAGLAWGAVRLLWQASDLARLRRLSRPATEADLPEEFADIVRRLGLSRVPEVRICPGLVSPAAFGVWRPTVLLPAQSATPADPAAMSAVLAHELTHLARRDPLWNWISALACAVCWWQPMVWWTAARLRIDSEFVADESAASSVGDGLRLADYLARLAAVIARPAPGDAELPAPAAPMAEFRSQLGRRVERLLNWEASSGAGLRRTGAGWLAVPAALALAALCPRLIPARETEARDPQPLVADGSAFADMAALPPERDVLHFRPRLAPPGAGPQPHGLPPMGFGRPGDRDILMFREGPAPRDGLRPAPPERLFAFGPPPGSGPGAGPGRPTPNGTAVRAVFVRNISADQAAAELAADPGLAELKTAADRDLSVVVLRGPAAKVAEAERKLRERDRPTAGAAADPVR